VDAGEVARGMRARGMRTRRRVGRGEGRGGEDCEKLTGEEESAPLDVLNKTSIFQLLLLNLSRV